MSNGLHPAATAATTPQARRGRSLVERIMVRTPRLLARLTGVVMRMPPSSRLRVSLLRYLYRRAYAAWNRRDWELNTILHDDDRYELCWAQQVIPGARSSYAGVAGYIEFSQLWLEAFGEFLFELLEVHDGGVNTVLSEIHQIGRGAGSGVSLDHYITSKDEFHHGMLVRQTLWWEAEEGLREHRLTSALRRK